MDARENTKDEFVEETRANSTGIQVKSGIKAGLITWVNGPWEYGEGEDWEFDSTWEPI